MMVDIDTRASDERKRYTSRLQRRAQAHVTNELGRDTGEDGIDRQVTMLIQHALESANAQRVTLYRPIPRGRRWQMISVLENGGYYYGLTSPDHAILPMLVCQERKPLHMIPGRPFEPAVPASVTSGYRSYIGIPLIAREQVVGVLEVVDLAQPEMAERHIESLRHALTSLTDALGKESGESYPREELTRPANSIAEPDAVLDTVLRPNLDADDLIEIRPEEWALLYHLDGERSIADVAVAARLSISQAATIAARLVERGLVRHGREDRRR